MFDPFLDSKRPADWPVHPAALSDEDLLKQCRIGRDRGSGPGGQHRNKVETTVVLTHEATGISVQAGERRTARENMQTALRRLRRALAARHRLPVPTGEARTETWRRRTQGRRLVVSERHQDHPAMVAEAMDMLAATGWEPRKASRRLLVSPTQIVRLVHECPEAWIVLNEERRRRGLHPLK